MANLSYVHDHHVRSLAGRLVALQHDHHEVVVSTTHVHPDPDNCLESTILKGPIDAVRSLADRNQAERGVRLATLNLVSMPSPAQSDMLRLNTEDGDQGDWSATSESCSPGILDKTNQMG